MNIIDIPITEDQKRAFDALFDKPISVQKFMKLSQYLIHVPIEDLDSFKYTDTFIKTHRLPKGKMKAWFDRHNIHSDGELMLTVYGPICQRFLAVDPSMFLPDMKRQEGRATE